ncbi:aryl-alcohol dehydrogenase-like predicted oxidoreductase [Silvibacterium bohemicum]|uniref:Aryl-alcohol dehydrogenase-like predicted oxidoreductase n=1 Tax=Silvibacterium bohemicum TaxID=1577686 RepID=A0A841JRX9_9BACT|nr:aldo/keto reductase [Silvibacterium bohemicum]MBB6144163.1 aryl-alcohol dehydrogenase-like predicted oxidoreductase [Silvibacterium bohemicum]
MEFTKFGRTGLTVSRLCLGTGTFGKQTDEAEAHRMLDRVAEAGVNLIDTADIYPPGAEAGTSEVITGRWLRGKRGQFILATKGGGRMGSAAWDQGNSRKHLLDAIDDSLRHLNTDYVDLYQLHMDDPATPLDEMVEAVDVIVRSGKARYIGVSNFLAYRLARALGLQALQKMTRFVSVQPRYNLLFREVERELFPLAQEEGIAVIPYNPLAGGLLSGRYKHGDTPDTGRFSTELGGFGKMYHARYWHEREFESVGKIDEIAEQQKIPVTTLSIAWVLANPVVTSVILGASRLNQLTDTLAAADYKLDNAAKAKLDEISSVYRRGDAGK